MWLDEEARGWAGRLRWNGYRARAGRNFDLIGRRTWNAVLPGLDASRDTVLRTVLEVPGTGQRPVSRCSLRADCDASPKLLDDANDLAHGVIDFVFRRVAS